MSTSSSTIISLQYVTQQVYIYAGFLIFTAGIISELLNILIFTTLNTFRNTPCGFYLTIVSIANFGQIIVAVLIRTLNYGLNIDLIQLSWICKIREFLVHFFALMAFTSICLAAIDQFFSLIRPQWSRLHLAHRNITIICLIWLGHNIPFLIYCDVSSGKCRNLNVTFSNYANYFIWPVLLGCLPTVIMIIFSVLAFYHVRMLNRHQRNIVRLSHDRQLTAMTLVYVIFIVLLTLPCIIFTILTIDSNNISAEQYARNRLIYGILSMMYYEGYGCSFYIYCCVSKRFRKQLIHVLFEIHLKRWKNTMDSIRNNKIGLVVANPESQHKQTEEVALY